MTSRSMCSHLLLSMLALTTLLAAGCESREEEFLSNVKPFEDADGSHADGREAGDGHSEHDHLTPLDEPTWVSGAAAPNMLAGDPVVGYVAGSRAWAIPWWILKNHHAANLTLDGEPVLILLCERCSSAAAWDPVVDGRRLHLRVN